MQNQNLGDDDQLTKRMSGASLVPAAPPPANAANFPVSHYISTNLIYYHCQYYLDLIYFLTHITSPNTNTNISLLLYSRKCRNQSSHFLRKGLAADYAALSSQQHPTGFKGLAGGNISSQGSFGQAKPTTTCLLYTSPSPRDGLLSRMPSSA